MGVSFFLGVFDFEIDFELYFREDGLDSSADDSDACDPEEFDESDMKGFTYILRILFARKTDNIQKSFQTIGLFINGRFHRFEFAFFPRRVVCPFGQYSDASRHRRSEIDFQRGMENVGR